jgi:hypothetical protein
MVALKSGMRFTTLYQLLAYREGPRLERVAFSEFGLVRIVRRKQRRFGMKRENPLVFYPRYGWRLARMAARYVTTYARLRLSLARAWRAWEKQDQYPYCDEAITPASGTIDPLIKETQARSTPYAKRRQELRARRDESV